MIAMPRFFLPEIGSEKVRIAGEDARHMAKSLRLTVGDEIILCDGKGWDYQGTIEEMDEEVTIRIVSKEETKSEPRAKVTLFQALPKGDKMELIIQKSVELGVHEIVPVLTSRCISRPDPKSMKKRWSGTIKLPWKRPSKAEEGLFPRLQNF